VKKLQKTLEIWEVDEHRSSSCAKYEDCLEAAAFQLWKSFSCLGCDQYEQGEQLTAQIRRSSIDLADYPADTYDCGGKSDLGRGLRTAIIDKGIQ